MTALVIYYSRSGHTERLARRIANQLGAERVEITAKRYRSSFFGYWLAAFDSLTGRMPTIAHPPLDIAAFDIVAIGAPVWTSYLATPIRAFLKENRDLPGRVGIFITSGSHSPPEATFKMATEILGGSPHAQLAVGNAKQDAPETEGHITDFVTQLRAA